MGVCGVCGWILDGRIITLRRVCSGVYRSHCLSCYLHYGCCCSLPLVSISSPHLVQVLLCCTYTQDIADAGSILPNDCECRNQYPQYRTPE